MQYLLVFSFLFLLLIAAVTSTGAEVENPSKCEKCGMDRTAFAHSRMLVVYTDNTTVGVCSLHCAAEELQQNRGKTVRSLMVADYATKELLEAKTATWVVGGKKHGVMTALAKWAFARAEDARRFVKDNGGELNSFAEALHAATTEVLTQAAEARAVESEMRREQR